MLGRLIKRSEGIGRLSNGLLTSGFNFPERGGMGSNTPTDGEQRCADGVVVGVDPLTSRETGKTAAVPHAAASG